MGEERFDMYIDIRDAAELTGYAVKHLRKLIRAGFVGQRATQGAPQIPWKDVQRLALMQRPFWVGLSEEQTTAAIPDPHLLLYTEDVEGRPHNPPDTFFDRVVLGDCVTWMRRMPPLSVQSVVTSPPYWGVRSYPGEQRVTWANGEHGAYGEEPTVEDYVRHTLEVLRHLKRVLRDDGTIWWNMGDTYQTRSFLRQSSTDRMRALEGDRSGTWKDYPSKRYSSGHSYLKDKDLTLVPFLVAIGAEHLGFYVRSVIVWHKDNTVPEPVGDRPTTTHEYILLLAKSRFYKYDKKREAEAAISGAVIKRMGARLDFVPGEERNLRTVWQFPTSSQHGNHTAAFPLELPLRCLRLSTSPGDLVFDPFAGSGTTLAAAKLLGCHYFGCDVVAESVQDAERRLLTPDQQLSHSQSNTAGPRATFGVIEGPEGDQDRPQAFGALGTKGQEAGQRLLATNEFGRLFEATGNGNGQAQAALSEVTRQELL